MFSYNHVLFVEELAAECISEGHFTNRADFAKEFLIQWYSGNTNIFVRNVDSELSSDAELRILKMSDKTLPNEYSPRCLFTNEGLSRYTFYTRMVREERIFFNSYIRETLTIPSDPILHCELNWDVFFAPLRTYLESNELSKKLTHLTCLLTLDIGLARRFFEDKGYELSQGLFNQLKPTFDLSYQRGRIPNTPKLQSKCCDALISLVRNRLYDPSKGSPKQAARFIKRFCGISISESGIEKAIAEQHQELAYELKHRGIVI